MAAPGGNRDSCRSNPVSNSRIDKLVQSLAVLVVDDNQYMRKVIRNILINLGVKNVHEAADGIAGLEAIRMFAPDMVILDWEMPLLNGAELGAHPACFPCRTFRSSCSPATWSAGA